MFWVLKSSPCKNRILDDPPFRHRLFHGANSAPPPPANQRGGAAPPRNTENEIATLASGDFYFRGFERSRTWYAKHCIKVEFLVKCLQTTCLQTTLWITF